MALEAVRWFLGGPREEQPVAQRRRAEMSALCQRTTNGEGVVDGRETCMSTLPQFNLYCPPRPGSRSRHPTYTFKQFCFSWSSKVDVEQQNVLEYTRGHMHGPDQSHLFHHGWFLHGTIPCIYQFVICHFMQTSLMYCSLWFQIIVFCTIGSFGVALAWRSMLDV